MTPTEVEIQVQKNIWILDWVNQSKTKTTKRQKEGMLIDTYVHNRRS